MPINNPDEVLRKSEVIEKENAEGEPVRKAKKELWKLQSLKDSLYNDESGKKVPRVSDIDQGSHSYLNYILKQYVIGDCYLLTNLMGLAKTKPSFIMFDLIKLKNKDEVEVGFYGTKESPIIKVTETSINIIYEPTTSKYFYSVSKDEALKWKTSHKALWPVVIEIAYAKHLKNLVTKNKGQLEKELRTSLREMIEQTIKNQLDLNGVTVTKTVLERFVESSIEQTITELLSRDTDLRKLFQGGIPALTLAHLIGAKSKQKLFSKTIDISLFDEEDKKKLEAFKGVDTTSTGAFQGEYSPDVLKLYNKIKKKLDTRSNKIITVSFKGVNTQVITSTLVNKGLQEVDDKEIALAAISFAKNLTASPDLTLRDLESRGLIDEQVYKKWLEKNDLTLDQLAKSSDAIRKKFILETVNFEKKFKISKTKTGIGAAHAYLVVDTWEADGYKYIVLKNPHNMDTRIDYRRSRKTPKEIKLPEQIAKEKNECMMELNHFYKKLAVINYDK